MSDWDLTWNFTHSERETTGLKTIDKTSLFEDMPIKNRTTFDTSKSEHDHIGDWTCWNRRESWRYGGRNWSFRNTDLGSLIGNFLCGYSTVRNIAIFLPLILREINFSWFQRVKNCHFDHFSSSEFEFLGKVWHF